MKKDDLKLEVLVSTMNADVHELVKKMQIDSDAIIINQCDKINYEEFYYKKHRIRVYSFNERGIGLSRNNALMRSNADYVLFCDDDEVLENNYEKIIINEFINNEKAGMLVFNINGENGKRKPYINNKYHKIHWYNCLRYGAVRFALKTEKIKKANIMFSLLFGGGAKYGSGEDSVFIYDCVKKNIGVYAIPINIAKVSFNDSSWFNGFTEKYFFDKGALFYSIFGKMAKVYILFFLLKNKEYRALNLNHCYKTMIKGYKKMKEQV